MAALQLRVVVALAKLQTGVLPLQSESPLHAPCRAGML